MAYVTGSAADITALRTAIFNACTANGWTLNGEVLSLGGTFVRIQVVSDTLTFLGGTGIDGGNNLTGAGPRVSRIAAFSGQAFVFPMTYEVHINTAPNEVYVVVNYNVDFYEWAAWGRSDVAGLTTTGNWYAASRAFQGAGGIIILSNSANSNSAVGMPPVLFGISGPGNDVQNSFIEHGFDGATWNTGAASIGPEPHAWLVVEDLQAILPNAWNSETVLLPIQAWINRTTGNKVSLAADVKHARYTRVDFHDPGDLYTIGADTWRIYPWYRKDIVNRNGGSNIQHTGTFGWAVRYTGP